MVWDNAVPGFGVRIRAAGSKTWIFQYRQGGKQRRLTFGDANAMTPAAARSKAEDFRAQVRLGQDPAGTKIKARAQAAETVGPAIARFLKDRKLKSRSRREVERHLNKYAKPLHSLQLANVNRGTVATLLGDIAQDSGPVAANCARSSLSAFFKWCMGNGLLGDNANNPVVGTNKAETNGARERVLSGAELLLIWNALKDDHYGAIVKLLALTGQRREEIGGLRWSEIDSEHRTITLPGERTKNGRKHSIPLSGAAWAIIEAQPRHADRDFIFGRRGPYPGWAAPKSALDQRTTAAHGGKPIAPWVLHDLRRTTATVMADRLKVQPHIIEAVLNHVSGHKKGVAGVYNRAPYDDEKRVALDRWADHLMAVVEGRTNTVVNLPLTA